MTLLIHLADTASAVIGAVNHVILAPTPPTGESADGWTWVDDTITKVKVVFLSLIGLAVVYGIGWTYHKFKAFVPTVGAVLLGAFVMWAVANILGLRDFVGSFMPGAGTGVITLGVFW